MSADGVLAELFDVRGTVVVVTASTAGLRQDPLVSCSYVVAKAGVVDFVRQAALDLCCSRRGRRAS